MTVTHTTITRDRWFAGTYTRIVAEAADTAGQLGVLEQRSRRGFSPPLHVHHREDTAMLILAGALTVAIGDDRRHAGPGDFVWLPRDVPHTFRVDSDEVHLLEFITPAGFEAFHVATSEPAAAPVLPEPSEPDVPRMLAVIDDYGAEIIGPPMSASD